MDANPKIAVIAATFWGNRGAEAMLSTTIGRMREKLPQARFFVFSYYPRMDRRLVQRPDVEILAANPRALVLSLFPFALLAGAAHRLGLRLPDWVLPRGVQRLRACDVLLDLGGITFVDGRERFLPFNVLTLLPAMLLGVPVVKLSQAMGPFAHRLNRWTSRAILRRCNLVFARGQVTAGHLNSLDVPTLAWERAADVAFAYRPEDSLSQENEDRVAALLDRMAEPASGRWIALSPSAVLSEEAARSGHDHAGEYLTALRGLADLRPPCSFVFVPNATRRGTTNSRNNDLNVINAIRRRAESEIPESVLRRMVWIDFDLNTRSIRQIIDRSNLLVTCRFHAMVAGLSLGVPTLVIGWGHKYLEVLADFGLESCNLDAQGWERHLPDRVADVLREADAIRDQMQRVLPSVRRSALRQFESVERLLS